MVNDFSVLLTLFDWYCVLLFWFELWSVGCPQEWPWPCGALAEKGRRRRRPLRTTDTWSEVSPEDSIRKKKRWSFDLRYGKFKRTCCFVTSEFVYFNRFGLWGMNPCLFKQTTKGKPGQTRQTLSTLSNLEFCYSRNLSLNFVAPNRDTFWGQLRLLTGLKIE